MSMDTLKAFTESDMPISSPNVLSFADFIKLD